MKLNSRQYSCAGDYLLILHGLFGSLSNWGWQSKMLAEDYAVTGLDLRNHGNSPHSDVMSYELMAADVIEFMDDNDVERCHVLGHSMGGKVAMQMALQYPRRISALVVVDVAPVAYESDHDAIFEGLQQLDISALQTRAEADVGLSDYIEEESVRRFILTNLVRLGEGGFKWRMNVSALITCYGALKVGLAPGKSFKKEVLFIKGVLSNYITDAHREEILTRFPAAKVKSILGAGHWLHAEKPQAFLKIVRDYLANTVQ